ncbi:TPA: hypothetical protein N0F65_002839 [Lagenidium giganteum]|uniref:PiggyBac transposable element-derived protein domain-containing protein n=1 Tax=Lagenidium giganteum TaxID=4803 RepID=A0AAV2Z7S8_9STRA|nr:TPA: hypothetical protein N0F65_002839 [Lagenidium giganteum]
MIFAGLLVTRSLHPWASGMRYHWRSVSHGPFKTGTFGAYMSRDRYKDVARCLHFADNNAASASADRYYKVNLLVDALNKAFRSAFTLGKAISFNEGTRPSEVV